MCEELDASIFALPVWIEESRLANFPSKPADYKWSFTENVDLSMNMFESHLI
jgi:hypothetical protein